MDKEKAEKTVQRFKEISVELAHSQAERAIGEAAVHLHAQGSAISKDSLIACLLDRAHGSPLLEREKHEQAARLLGWAPVPPV